MTITQQCHHVSKNFFLNELFPLDCYSAFRILVPEQVERATEFPVEPAAGGPDGQTGRNECNRQADIGIAGEAPQEKVAESAISQSNKRGLP